MKPDASSASTWAWALSSGPIQISAPLMLDVDRVAQWRGADTQVIGIAYNKASRAGVRVYFLLPERLWWMGPKSAVVEKWRKLGLRKGRP